MWTDGHSFPIMHSYYAHGGKSAQKFQC